MCLLWEDQGTIKERLVVLSYTSSYRELREAAMKLMGDPIMGDHLTDPTYITTAGKNIIKHTLEKMKIYIDWGKVEV